eukprot:CAMPEP_0195042592 /NCGR_PEP_ID=MMETSP0347-20130606/2872_1 /TAXON_ID=2932 /ORGANISM="Alexandrium fundyense, Strain CCMP1719" /LENGTH=77 /DNA_ID=CAMNT_0040069851 /DNA_START=61 /DNA_END=290 /DNA_ORIENTATION=-
MNGKSSFSGTSPPPNASMTRPPRALMTDTRSMHSRSDMPANRAISWSRCVTSMPQSKLYSIRRNSMGSPARVCAIAA